jgi:hypothetical protein
LKIEDGFASLADLDEVLLYQKSLKTNSRLLYLKLSDFSSLSPIEVRKKFTFSGYDYGNYIWEDNYYSLIYHEIIGGSKEEFKNYVQYLNKNLLFSSLVHISAVEKTKMELKAKGENLEEELQGEKFQPIAVYSYNESN